MTLGHRPHWYVKINQLIISEDTAAMEIHVTIRGRDDLSGQIYRQLRSGIVEGRLAAGERLPSTPAPATQLAPPPTTPLHLSPPPPTQPHLPPPPAHPTLR